MALLEDARVGDTVLLRSMESLTEQIKSMAAIYEQSRNPPYYVSPPTPISGNDLPIPPYAVIAIVQNPSGSALSVSIGGMTYSVAANQLMVLPTLRAITFKSVGPGTVIFSNRYEDRGFVSSTGLI
jgi:hypothetical protein